MDWEEIDVGGRTWYQYNDGEFKRLWPKDPPPDPGPKAVTQPGPIQIRMFLDGKFWGQLNPYLRPDGLVEPFSFAHVPAGHDVTLKYGITIDSKDYIWKDIPMPRIISNGGNLNFEGMRFYIE